MLDYRDNCVLNAFTGFECACVCRYAHSMGRRRRIQQERSEHVKDGYFAVLKILGLLQPHLQVLFMARITVPKALCKHATKRWFLCKRAYIYQMSGDSNWLQRGRHNKEWILGKRTAECQGCIHPHNILSLIFGMGSDAFS